MDVADDIHLKFQISNISTVVTPTPVYRCSFYRCCCRMPDMVGLEAEFCELPYLAHKVLGSKSRHLWQSIAPRFCSPFPLERQLS
eukprot:3511272-Ditylum_brightwellii.AAC.1